MLLTDAARCPYTLTYTAILESDATHKVTKRMSGRKGLPEEGGECIVPTGPIGWHLTVWLDSMLQTVQLPAGIADLQEWN